MNPFKNLFQKKIVARPTVPFSAEELAGPVKINRQTLQLIDSWIDDKAFTASFFNYGVPDFIKLVINKPVGEAVTYTDLMALIAKKYFEQVNYLEIGVSVGKNFFQLLRALDRASLTGFDIEEINPVLERQLSFLQKSEWPTPRGSVKKNNSSLKTYTAGDKNVAYLSADVWDEASWEKLQGSKYNIVFSDALHTPKPSCSNSRCWKNTACWMTVSLSFGTILLARCRIRSIRLSGGTMRRTVSATFTC